jgi:hypothetical protein
MPHPYENGSAALNGASIVIPALLEVAKSL